MIEPLSDDSKAVLSLVRKHPGLGKSEISLLLGIDLKQVELSIDNLLKKGLIEGKKSDGACIKRTIELHVKQYPHLWKGKDPIARLDRILDKHGMYYPA